MARYVKLFVLFIFMCALVVPITAETPFTEKEVKVEKSGQSGQDSSAAVKEDEAGNKKKEDSKKENLNIYM